MILSCPSCGAKFTVADHAFAGGPRQVRCARCKNVWRAGEEAPVITALPPPAPPPEKPHETTPVVLSANATAIPFSEAFAPPLLPPIPEAEPERHEADHVSWRERFAWITPWHSLAASGIMAAAILVILVFAHHGLSIRAPAFASFYAALGLYDDIIGLSLDLQLTRAEKCVVSGRDMLCLEGKIANNASRALPVPPVAVTALDGEGKGFMDENAKPILTWTIAQDSGKLLPGETRGFSLTVPYPQQAVADFDYGFIDAE